MPKINLKPNSAEFADKEKNCDPRICDMHGCNKIAEHKAPKNRGLNEYYYFCLDHAREYNKSWNFFEGMSDSEVQEQTINAMYGDRPTWKYGVNGDPYAELYKKAWQTFNNTEEDPYQEARSHKSHDPGNQQYSQYSQEYKAMQIMGLEPPLTLEGIKSRYKELAKTHHPDLNKGSKASEDLLKEINMAYTILKLAYESYEKIKDKS